MPSASALPDQLAEALDTGLAVMQLDSVHPDQRQLLIQYVLLLQRWNSTHNLTAVRDPLEMISRHLLDSLAALPFLDAGRVADIGSGAGLPGIPLAICRPAQAFTLVEPAGKRVAFLRSVLAELGLSHVQVVPTTSEKYQPENLPDILISRATAPLARLDAMTIHLQGPQSRVLALKGPGVEEELADWPRAAAMDVHIHDLQVPGSPLRKLLIWTNPLQMP
ncbi:16S rRNA (guanine(527)-N(7))-methyltransferase RsmG [Acidithiobacillus thiooxidans]|uniref:Ribosomal RNA small subunit methyltransferase G n=2 Tax=Acidithiobacillus thiooxidans TaxID=930 RepID=A0A1C2HVL6_ACITH|nr:16S rRNA (guanine(527)-N(7))-methyltransferase RsmG [Acidithiobacillus thiooxidans]MDR7928671.1 16S rRNA (guanine(527)-N(7))-methyltransferase RsmG [Acidithiobacillus thiooxidans]MDX5933618.1 16S rRNA (guanine(527)-N(7))-methyltransferase RsmG [Acidithiobacillus thiooxidans]OCX67782.1 16S rRNA (guanine(527)-N(7))-methyltransferase RsmG [Acidithiobacillus thiooxidans]OCX72339.1 16S rRNA (guanine(527)-N(7))-methyltransferase RsmG [Acidithiobacillus thiooxidans]OCX81914.1 16S rRNA (guanine(527